MNQRFKTAVVIILICIIPIVSGSWLFVALAGVAVVGIGTSEVINVRKEKNWPIAFKTLIYFYSFLMLFWSLIRDIIYKIIYKKPDVSFDTIFSIGENYVVSIPIIFAVFALLTYFVIAILDERVSVEDIFYVFGLQILLVVAGQCSFYLRFHGLNAFIFVLFTNVITDTFAYIFGVNFGKNKLCPRISPKKTIEGAIGGTVSAVILGGLCYMIFPFGKSMNLLYAFILSFLIALGAQFGDLMFSLIKRNYKIKDFGTIFPGHGGILDRLDSIVFSLIVFYAIYGLITGGSFI